MPTVDVKFVANELTPGLVNGEYCIEEGITIRGLISLCESRSGISLPPENFKLMYPLFNGKPASIDSAITKDGTLHICRIVVGG
jgi:hypothetical protein